MFTFLPDYLATYKNFRENKVAKKTTLQWDPSALLYFRKQNSKYMRKQKC
jgi:hypothetical protein